MRKLSLLALFLFCAPWLNACKQLKTAIPLANAPSSCIKASGSTLATRIMVPEGYARIVQDEHSFGHFLRQLELMPDGSKVHLYNGEEKQYPSHIAVIKMDIGKRDLEQCADAAMRLRAEYLFHEKRFDEIHFPFTSGFDAQYSEWRKGKRIKVSGNNVTWVSGGEASDSYASFRNYLDIVFTYAGSLSLSRALSSVPLKDIQPGDLFVKGGSPGHVETVMDVAVNAEGKRIFLLAQSWMPAQEIEILKNSDDDTLNPWYRVEEGQEVNSPQFTFEPNSLMRWYR
jgi:hypothetical protein